MVSRRAKNKNHKVFVGPSIELFDVRAHGHPGKCEDLFESQVAFLSQRTDLCDIGALSQGVGRLLQIPTSFSIQKD